mgnify:CR=1 FL=1
MAKVKKIPMKKLTLEELAELTFDRGVTQGSSATANRAKGSGMKRGAYSEGVGKEKGGVITKLPKPSPRRKMKTPKPKPKRGDLNESMSSNEKMKPVNLKDGGAVPSKFKGFSKLPEAVQEKMNPSAAKKYKNGGAVLAGRGGSFKGTR